MMFAIGVLSFMSSQFSGSIIAPIFELYWINEPNVSRFYSTARSGLPGLCVGIRWNPTPLLQKLFTESAPQKISFVNVRCFLFTTVAAKETVYNDQFGRGWKCMLCDLRGMQSSSGSTHSTYVQKDEIISVCRQNLWWRLKSIAPWQNH